MQEIRDGRMNGATLIILNLWIIKFLLEIFKLFLNKITKLIFISQ